jgi:hypothetical protein
VEEIVKERILVSCIRNQTHPAIAGLVKSLGKRGDVSVHRYRKRASKIGVEAMNSELIALAASVKPTVFLFEKGETIRPGTLSAIGDALPNCTIIQQCPDWYIDNRSGRARGVVERGIVSDITLFPFGDGDDLGMEVHNFYRKSGCKRTNFWYKGVDPEEIQPLNIEPEYDVVFLGAVTGSHPFGAMRKSIINRLAEKGFKVCIYYGGDGSLHDSIDVRSYVGSAYPWPAANGKINIDWRGKSPYMCTSSDRIFPAMASGLLYLTTPFSGIETLFTNGEHLLWYDQIDQCVELVGQYVQDDDGRERVGKAARERVIEVRSADVMTDLLFTYIDQFRQGEGRMKSRTGIEFDRCIRVNGKKVYVIRGDRYIHIRSYGDLERWCDTTDIEDVDDFDFSGMRQVTKLMRKRG